ncbi:MAG: 2-hydroxyacyl-CoA dehydratase [Actinobacteria bacterium]|nr:2-hydroxyacyl-CoA dehydratase [Actinomycetota bacterium]
MCDTLSTLFDMRQDPYSGARSLHAAGRSILGYSCSYVPEELIYAAGVVPVRILGDNKQRVAWGGHLQNYCCSLSRSTLDMALNKEFDFVDGFVFGHTCDTMQRLSDILRINAGFEFHADLVAPSRLNGEAAFGYMLEELGEFRSKLEARYGPISDERIVESMAVYHENRKLVRKLYELKKRSPGKITSTDLIWAATAGYLMDRAGHTRLLRALLDELESLSVTPEPGDEKIPLFGIGSVMDQWEFLDMMETAGGTFINDDFCNGGRYAEDFVPGPDEPMAALARSLMGRASCPCKHGGDRSTALIDKVKYSGAAGVVFFLLKYCDPHSFEYPHLKYLLGELGVPSILVEIEHGAVSMESMRTRIEALLETIKGLKQAR